MGFIGLLRRLFGRRHKIRKRKEQKRRKLLKLKHKQDHNKSKKHAAHNTLKAKHKSLKSRKTVPIKRKNSSQKIKTSKIVAKKRLEHETKKIPQKKSRKKYGIPKGHAHEAKLKIAERRSEIDEFYTEPKGKVSLKVMDKGSMEFEKVVKDDHEFAFKERKFSKKEKREIKKIEDVIKIKKESGFVTTNMDTILNIVNKMGKVRADYLSGALKMNEKSVEGVARILAKNDLIDIHYPLIGKMELKRKGGKNV